MLRKNGFAIIEFLTSILIKNHSHIPNSTDFIKANKLVSIYGALKHDLTPDLRKLLYKQKGKRRSSEIMHHRIRKCFTDASLKYAVIKGMSFAKAIYGNFDLRDVGDIDILVNTEDVGKAHKALSEMGYKQ